VVVELAGPVTFDGFGVEAGLTDEAPPGVRPSTIPVIRCCVVARNSGLTAAAAAVVPTPMAVTTAREKMTAR
jgi:hypothetical protein